MRYYCENYLTAPDGAELWYALLGEGDPVLVTCDGLGCEGFAWKYLVRDLGPRHRILRWNYRGHGRSGLPRTGGRLRLEDFADDLARVMDAAGIDRGVVLGHSMGVQVALEFHKRHPEKVLALIPICGSYGHPLDTFHDHNKVKLIFPYLRAAAERLPFVTRAISRTVLPSELAYQYALWMEVNRHLVRREDFEPYFTHLGRMDPLAFLRTLEAASEHSAWDHLPHIDVPTLVVAAEYDRFTPVWLSRRMHQAIPGSELLVVPGGTHTAVIEMPELIGLRIERFLKDHLLASRAA